MKIKERFAITEDIYCAYCKSIVLGYFSNQDSFWHCGICER